MDTAINAKTNLVVNAWALELKDPMYQMPYEEKWYADLNNIDSYDNSKVANPKQIEVRFRKASYDVINYKGTKYDMPPSFFILNKEELGINTIPESKEHKLAKNWIYNSGKKGEISFTFSTVSRPFDYSNKINLNQLKVAYDKIYIEVPVRVGRKKQRADIIIPFEEFHDLLGAGIVVEIQFSKQTDEERDERTINWALKGYSICWIKFDDFETIEDNFIQLKDNSLNVEVYAKTIKNFADRRENDFRIKLQEYYRSSYEKIKEFEDLVVSLKKDIDKYAQGKVIETSEQIQSIKESLKTREALLVQNISQIENNPMGIIFESYKTQLQNIFEDYKTKEEESWKKKMNELNYPFVIKECPMCRHGLMYRKQTKTGKLCYGCSAYPNCKHTIWVN